MIRRYIHLLPFLLTCVLSAGAAAQDPIKKELKQHILYLSDDKLEGRATGTKGEQLAAEYISNVFTIYGIPPAGDNGTYLQSFEARAGKKPGAGNFIRSEHMIQMSDLVYPHPMSANGTITGKVLSVGFGITAPSLGYDDYAQKDVKGKIVLVKTSSPDGTHPHSKYIEFNDERKKIQTAVQNGATAILFYNEDANYTLPAKDYRRNVTPEGIPAFIIDAATAHELMKSEKEIVISVELNEEVRNGHNVLGFINNNAATTVVIGAHYDHLGHGDIEGSLYRGEPAIHNGADDNASGIALMLLLSKALKQSDLTNNNYLFIAFSGEEMGLYGSKAFVNSPLMQQYSVNYMLNYDMVGRLDTSNTIIINGAGTSADWSVLKDIRVGEMKVNTTESGIGPSDQTSFYLKDIPVLHFFTGSHNDYHKPSDDEAFINYEGIDMIGNYSMQLIRALNEKGRINFTKTKDSSNENTPRFTVTMGIVPDYAYSGKGMRVDGVSDGKPAQKAGVLAGDIIIKLGTFEVTDMMAYMTSLGKFSKGQSTTVTVLRNNEMIELPVQF